MKPLFCGVFVLIISLTTSFSQSKYWIYFKDKSPLAQPAISETTIHNRISKGLPRYDESDLPVSQEYNDRLKYLNIEPAKSSKWLNAVSATLNSQQIEMLRQQDFVKEVSPINPGFYIARNNMVNKVMMAPVMEQVQSDVFKKAGYTGKGITIGVIDAGFFGADSSDALRHIFENNRVKGIRDFVKPNQSGELLYSVAESFSDIHGTEVMSAISGIDNQENVQYGLALNSKFYLARTDYSLREWRGEEDNWIAALEWMDSLGVKVVNTSLGYAKGFTNPEENYIPSQMDGKTSAISRAAQIAADQKGILLIVSAGNEGDDKSWKIVSTPADAEGVLSVGATNQRLWTRIGYSSIGPDFLSYLKPNVSCFSLYGTSLSAPVITGFAACLMQAQPELSNKEIISIIEQSAHLYPYGNNFVGYGVPRAARALELLKNKKLSNTNYMVKVKGRNAEIPVNTNENLIALYRKKNERDVISQQTASVTNGKVTLRRQSGERQTTIDLKDSVIEVVWE